MAEAGMLMLFNNNSVGDSPPFDVSSSGFKDWTCDVNVSDNNTSAVVVGINGNTCSVFDCPQSQLDKYSATWLYLYSLSTAELASGATSFTINNTPLQRIRGSLVTLTTTGGTNPYVTVRCMGAK